MHFPNNVRYYTPTCTQQIFLLLFNILPIHEISELCLSSFYTKAVCKFIYFIMSSSVVSNSSCTWTKEISLKIKEDHAILNNKHVNYFV